MKKIPIELITTLTSSKPFSPVVWDGFDIVVSQDSDLNLKKISTSLIDLSKKVGSHDSQLANQRQEFNRIGPNVGIL